MDICINDISLTTDTKPLLAYELETSKWLDIIIKMIPVVDLSSLYDCSELLMEYDGIKAKVVVEDLQIQDDLLIIKPKYCVFITEQ